MGDIVSSVGDFVSGAVDKVSSNPTGAIMAAATGNPMYLASYALPGGSAGSGLLGAGLGAYGAYQAGQSAQNANQLVSQMSQFRPVGITTRFGSSNFQTDPTTGKLTSAGYSLSPEAAAYQNQLSGMTGLGLLQGRQLQGLSAQYLGESPEAVRQRYIQQQTSLLAPKREQDLAAVRNKLFQTGRSGLATGATTAGNLAATNPELAAYYNAIAQQDAALAAGAEQAAQNQIKFGQGLAAGAYEPFKSGFGAMQTVEQAGQQALGLGSELGGLASSAAQRAAPYQYQASAYNPTSNLLANPQLQSALGSGLNSLFGSNTGSLWAGSHGGLNTSNIDYGYLSNIYSGGNPYAGTIWDGE